jgi:hypothetical protein
MNKRKGFFRSTLILSFLYGMLSASGIISMPLPKVVLGVFKQWAKGSGQRTINIALPGNWKGIDPDQKLKMINELDTNLLAWEKERDSQIETWSSKNGDSPPPRGSSMLGIIFEDEFSRIGAPYFELSLRDKREVRKQLKERITAEKMKMPEQTEIWSYNVFLGPDWIRRGMLILTRFAIGFALIWLIYALMRWVVVGFVVEDLDAKGNTHKKSPGQ